jgi:hypothetical protein
VAHRGGLGRWRTLLDRDLRAVLPTINAEAGLGGRRPEQAGGESRLAQDGMTSPGCYAMFGILSDGPALWHDRLILWVEPQSGECEVLTPDGDVYLVVSSAVEVSATADPVDVDLQLLVAGSVRRECCRFRELAGLSVFRTITLETSDAPEMILGADVPSMELIEVLVEGGEVLVGDEAQAALAAALGPAPDRMLVCPSNEDGRDDPEKAIRLHALVDANWTRGVISGDSGWVTITCSPAVLCICDGVAAPEGSREG